MPYRYESGWTAKYAESHYISNVIFYNSTIYIPNYMDPQNQMLDLLQE